MNKGSFIDSFKNASGGSDIEIQRDIVLDEVAHLIKNYPQDVVNALNSSGSNVSENVPTRKLVSLTVNQLRSNRDFRHQLATLIANMNSKTRSFSNSNGDQAVEAASTIGGSTAAGAQAGPVGAIVGAIAGVFEAGFNFGASKKEAESEDERTKRELLDKIFGEKKTNWLPIVVVGGVLLIGGVVLVLTLRNKK